MKQAFAYFLANAIQAVAEVASVAVEEAFALQEIAEHQPVQHKGGIPVANTTVGETFDEFAKGILLGLKPVVEALGDFVAMTAIRSSVMSRQRESFQRSSNHFMSLLPASSSSTSTLSSP